MEKAKSWNIKTLIIGLLSVLLIVSVAVGGTLAWFADNDTSTGKLTMGGSVLVDLGNSATGSYTDKTTTNIEFTGTNLVPNQPINTNIQVNVAQSTTNAYLRLKVDVEAGEDNEAQADAMKTEMLKQMQSAAGKNGWKLFSDGFYYYVGGSITETYTAGALDTTQASKVDSSTAASNIKFIVSDAADAQMRLPSTWTNDYALAEVEVTITVQAIQTNYIDDNDSAGTEEHTVTQVAAVMDEAFTA